jgi:integrase
VGGILKRGTRERPRFYVYFTDVDGTRCQRAAKGARTEKEARTLLAAIELRIHQGQVGVPEAPKPDPDAERRRTVTIRELGDDFTARYSDRKKKDIVEYRKHQATELNRIYPKLGDRAAASITRRNVDAFLQALTDEEYAPSSVNNSLNTLSKVYGWARGEGLIDCANPCAGIERFDAGDGEDDESSGAIEPDKYLARDEGAQLLSYVEGMAVVGVASWQGLMLHPMAATGIYAGLRKGELYGLKWSHVDLQRGQITVSRSYAGKTKSKKTRHLPIAPRLAPILRAWRERCPKTDAGLVFPMLENAGEMGASWDMLGLEEAMKAAGVRVPQKTWHGLRHTFAATFMMSGGNILTLQKLLGHADVKTTMIYAHLAPDFMAAEVARLDFSLPSPAGVTDIAEARPVYDSATRDHGFEQAAGG